MFTLYKQIMHTHTVF